MFAPRALARGERAHDSHDARDDEPHADDEREDDERLERLLDEDEPGDGAEHAQESEQPAALARAKDRDDDRETPSTSTKMPAMAVKVLSVSCGETTKKMPTPSATTPHNNSSHRKLVTGCSS